MHLRAKQSASTELLKKKPPDKARVSPASSVDAVQDHHASTDLNPTADAANLPMNTAVHYTSHTSTDHIPPAAAANFPLDATVHYTSHATTGHNPSASTAVFVPMDATVKYSTATNTACSTVYSQNAQNAQGLSHNFFSQPTPASSFFGSPTPLASNFHYTSIAMPATQQLTLMQNNFNADKMESDTSSCESFTTISSKRSKRSIGGRRKSQIPKEAIKSPTRFDVQPTPTNTVNHNTININQNSVNRFAPLGSDLDFEYTNQKISNKTVLPKNVRASNGVSRPKKVSCPPIILYNINIKHLVDQLETREPKVSFKIKNVNKSKSKLFIEDMESYSWMMALLKEKKINSYSFTPKDQRQVSLILRGLYYLSDLTDIKSALDVLVPNTISKVSKFSTPFSLKSKIETGLFLISLHPGKKLGDINHIRFVLSQAVLWETPKAKMKEIQCRRCQHWGHVARNCNRKFTCVKCDLDHEPGECLLTRDNNSKPFCNNCKQFGHPANWRGCSAFKNFVSEKKKRLQETLDKKQKASQNVHQAVANLSSVNNNKSFASLFYTPKSNMAPLSKRSPIIEEFLKLADYFMAPEPSPVEQEIQNYLANYKKMPVAQAKAEYLSLFSKIKNSYGP